MKMRMFLFFIIFFSIYGSVHAYTYYHILSHLLLSLKFKIILGIFFLFMTLSIPIARLIELYFPGIFSRGIVIISSVWIGFIFYFFILFLIKDIILLFIKLLDLNNNNKEIINFLKSNSNVLLIIFSLTIIICIYAYYEALNIKITSISIPNNKSALKEKSLNLNIVQLSDIHLGILVGYERVEKMVKLINKINPDIIVITGDLLDAEMDHIDKISLLFKNLKPRYGKYAVTGNHEFYAGINKAVYFCNEAEIELLRNDVKIIPGIINIIGLDDPTFI
ncbi:MAG: metallophosphoesterase [Candidatus Firestonebacteria bacterium]|nr:metallophosphoesterase [Candidatus Firestonebacteria bacterium]